MLKAATIQEPAQGSAQATARESARQSPRERSPAAAAEAIAAGFGSRTLARPRLSEQVAAELEHLIVSGKLQAGDTLPSERDLMSTFGVGRTSIREALFALQRKGIVTAQAGARPVVSQPRAETIVAELSATVRLFLATDVGTREFQAARRFFEPAVAGFAALNATDDDIDAMAASLAACDACLRDPQRFVDADVEFHFAIVKATHNELLIALHRGVVEWLREQRISSVEPRGSALAAQRAHHRVFDAIRQRDADAASAAMLEHLLEVEKYYWKARRATEPAAARTTSPRKRNDRRKLK